MRKVFKSDFNIWDIHIRVCLNHKQIANLNIDLYFRKYNLKNKILVWNCFICQILLKALYFVHFARIVVLYYIQIHSVDTIYSNEWLLQIIPVSICDTLSTLLFWQWTPCRCNFINISLILASRQNCINN